MVSRRNRAWADTLFDVNIVSGAAAQNSDLLANAPAVDTITAVRILIRLEAWPPLLSLVDGAMSFDVAIGVSSLEAFGVNALPDPNTDNEYPPRGWLYIDRGFVRNANSSTGPVDQASPAVMKADVRSMRRVDKGKLFLAMSASLLDGSGFDLRVAGRVRVLCLT